MSEKESKAVKAYVRVRPFTAREMAARPQPCIRPKGNLVLVEQEVVAQAEAESGKTLPSPRAGRRDRGDKDKDKEDGDSPTSSQNHTFEFDGVFWSVPPNQVLSEQEAQDDYYLAALPPFASQEQLFQEVGVSAVDSLLKGFPVTVFAYGQTGSGKSHTIFGPMSDPGLSPRMAAELFRIIDAERAFGWRVEVALSCFEIYNERVTDLLSKTAMANSGKSSPKQLGSSINRRRAASSAGRMLSSQRSFGTFSASPLELDDVHDGAASIKSHGSGQDPWTPTRAGHGGSTPRTPRTDGLFPPGEGDDEGGEDNASSINDCASGICDLPSSGGNASAYASPPRAGQHDGGEARELRVRQHPDLGVFVEGLRKEQVTDAQQLTGAINTALHHRVTAATKMNDTSSRSHAVIQVSVDVRDEVLGKRRAAVMNIIDLAGSERISRSGVSGQQLSEAKNINLSLTTLRRVIDVITENAERKQKQKQVPPFRESTLTWILMDCFGGSSVTIMLATASPHLDNIGDTISTMRYATKCKTIVNHVRPNESKIAVTIAAINAESERIRRGLREVESNRAEAASAMRQEKAKVVRKNNVIKAVIKPSHDRMRAGRDEAERLLKEATEALRECGERIDARERKGNSDAEVALIAQRNTHTKVATELEYRTYRRTEDDIQHYKAEINQMLNIAPTSNAGMFKSMRRTAIRRQIIMYAQEQRDKPVMAALQQQNEAMAARLEGYAETLAALDQSIAEEAAHVEVARAPERIRDAAAVELSDAHERISESIEGFRHDTGVTNKQIAGLQKELASLDAEGAEGAAAMAEWDSFHGELASQLHVSGAEVAGTIRGLTTEVEELLADYAAVRKRRRGARDALVMTTEAVRLAVDEVAEQSLTADDLRAEAAEVVAAIADAKAESERVRAEKAEALAAEEQLKRHLEAMERLVSDGEHVIRTRCFPDASELYCDRVLARMAVDLEAAAAVSPSAMERLRPYIGGGEGGSPARHVDPSYA